MTLKWLRKKQDLSAYADGQLMRLHAEGPDPEALGVLFQRYVHLLLATANKYLRDADEAQDAVMMVFEKLLAHPQQEEIKNFGAWIHTLCKNECLMLLRKRKTLENWQEQWVRENTSGFMENGEWEHQIFGNSGDLRLQYLEASLLQLNDEQRQCVEMFYREGKSYQQIMETTGLAYNSVKSHIQNGKRNLKLFIEQRENHG